MAIDNNSALLDATGAFINQRFQEQSWFKENSNFITSAGGFLATLVAWAATQPFADDARVQVAILLVGFVLTTLGVKVTPNGISKSQMKKFSQANADYVDSQPLVVERPMYQDDGPENASDVLDAMVAEYNKA
ncbi:hypothetical protein R3O64_09635 [Corynebacterium hesseae]|uniref:hypothetical protein n=1 Tax=Corynebacterium hesseae TaxID=2913502 RepID=UPI0030D302AB